MDEKLELRPPIVVLGREGDYLHATATVQEAVKHASGRFGAGFPLLNDMVQFFDVAGRRLEPLDEGRGSDTWPVTDSKDYGDYVREQIGRVIANKAQGNGFQTDSVQEREVLGDPVDVEGGEKAVIDFNPDLPGLEEVLRLLAQPNTMEELVGTLVDLLREPEDAPGPVLQHRSGWWHNTFCH